MKRLTYIIPLFLITLFLQTSLAVTEAELSQNKFEVDIVPFWKTQVQHHYVNLKDGYNVSHRHHIAFYQSSSQLADNLLVILPGQGEAAMKYAELVYDLQSINADIVVFDHLGQGESENLSKADRSHIDSFSGQFVTPLHNYLKEVLPQYKNRHLLSHSMGGNVALRYLELYPNDFQKTVLSSPMLLPRTGAFPASLAHAISASLTKLSLGKKMAFGQKTKKEMAADQSKSTVSHSNERIKIQSWLNNNRMDIVRGGVTFGWVNAALSSSKIIKKNAKSINIPVLLFQAREDSWVSNKRQNELCKTQFSNCKMIHFEHARHEILQEEDAMRDKALKEMMSFFEL